MGIKSFIKMSLTDWDGKVSAVIFTGGCNFKCPYCHNWQLATRPEELVNLDQNELFNELELFSGWLDGVVITGGEPSLFDGLKDLMCKIRDLDMKVKLDTNGSNPSILKELIADDLIDYISMDVKNSYEKYPETVCTNIDTGHIKESIGLLKSFKDYEFRTTVVPGLVLKEDLEKICSYIEGSKLYTLQRYHPENVISKNFSELSPQTDEEMMDLVSLCSEYVTTKWRG